MSGTFILPITQDTSHRVTLTLLFLSLPASTLFHLHREPALSLSWSALIDSELVSPLSPLASYSLLSAARIILLKAKSVCSSKQHFLMPFHLIQSKIQSLQCLQRPIQYGALSFFRTSSAAILSPSLTQLQSHYCPHFKLAHQDASILGCLHVLFSFSKTGPHGLLYVTFSMRPSQIILNCRP